MPLFRFHRGSLEESLKTTIIVKNLNDVVKAIVTSQTLGANIDSANWPARFAVEPYPSEGNNFDPRIGWYTHVVICNIYKEDEMNPVGFLSESLPDVDIKK